MPNKLNIKEEAEQLIRSGKYTNKQITTMLGTKKDYVATLKRRMKNKPVDCKTQNMELVNRVFG